MLYWHFSAVFFKSIILIFKAMDQFISQPEAMKKLDKEICMRIDRAISEAITDGKNEVKLGYIIDPSCKKRCRQLIIEAGYDCPGKDDEWPVFFIDKPAIKSDQPVKSEQSSSLPQKFKSAGDEKDDTD